MNQKLLELSNQWDARLSSSHHATSEEAVNFFQDPIYQTQQEYLKQEQASKHRGIKFDKYTVRTHSKSKKYNQNEMYTEKGSVTDA